MFLAAWQEQNQFRRVLLEQRSVERGDGDPRAWPGQDEQDPGGHHGGAAGTVQCPRGETDASLYICQVWKQIYSLDIQIITSPHFTNDLFSSASKLFSATWLCWYFKDAIKSRHKVIAIGKHSYLTPSPHSGLL